MSDPQNSEDNHTGIVGVDPDFAVGINEPDDESDADDESQTDEGGAHVPGSDQL